MLRYGCAGPVCSATRSGNSRGPLRAVVPDKEFMETSIQFGISSSLDLAASPITGRGLWFPASPRPLPGAEDDRSNCFLQVPADLILSDRLEGAVGFGSLRPPELEECLGSGIDRWELRLGSLLLWAVHQPPSTAIGRFWRWYRAHIPGPQEQTSLLFFQLDELACLPDPPTVAAARRWQDEVADFYQRNWTQGPLADLPT